MASSFFAAKSKDKQRFHTPTTFRAQRQLQFSTPTTPTPQRQMAAAHGLTNLQNYSPSASATSSQQSATTSNANANQTQHPITNATTNPSVGTNPQTNGTPQQALLNQRILPWDVNGSRHTKLYNTAAPKIVYPAGSRDEEINQRFIKQMDMYLNRNFLVRSIMKGDTPHPFLYYERLEQYWQALGTPQRKFNPAETFTTLDEIQAKGH